jgi:hypothetical protein
MASTANDASCATAPLTPVVEVSPARATVGENITLTVKIQVNEESNVSASNLQINGAGDVFLIFKNDSIIVEPEKMGELKWIFNATKLGSVHFSFGLSVTNMSDQSVTLSESLSSKEIGISKSSGTFILGITILAIFILLSSYYNDWKPRQSLYELCGGALGIAVSIFFAIAAGVFVASILVLHLGWPIMLTLGAFGLILILIGLSFCQRNKNLLKNVKSKTEITELGGLLIVIVGLASFFGYLESYFEMVLLISVGLLGIGKEYIEMETKENYI